MALSPQEQELLDAIERHLEVGYDDIDPIERAITDGRVVAAARYMVLGETEPPFDNKELAAVIGMEYELTHDELDVVMEMAIDRVGEPHGQA